ncbi:hypothetical protein AsACE_CH00265 [Acinetobacter schindleri]|nr:hypothetical protein AsACE_CH00265 [Acinetobacter schindleri]
MTSFAMNELQALVQGQISPQAIPIDHLLQLAERYTDPNSTEYKLIELAANIILAKSLDKALKYL